jgi:hypothetical protein
MQESSLATIRKENAARRDLLLSLGVDLDAQANYIASSTAVESQDIRPDDSSLVSLSLPALDESNPVHEHVGPFESGVMAGATAIGQSDSLPLFVGLNSENTSPGNFAND